MFEEIKCANCNNERFSKIDDYGWSTPNSPYRKSTPITITDNTLSFEVNECKCCNTTKEYKLEKQHDFCSYQCFWEWAEKNIPKDDANPKDRLKEEADKTKNEYYSYAQLLYEKINEENK